MNKTLTRILTVLALLLAVVMLLSLAACGKEEATAVTEAPAAPACCAAGTSRLNTAAALITPPEKPMQSLFMRAPIRLRKKKTSAEPSVVMSMVNIVPHAAQNTALIEPPHCAAYASRGRRVPRFCGCLPPENVIYWKENPFRP